MPFVQAKYFKLATGQEPPNCTVDSATKVIAELLLTSEYGSSHEEVNMITLDIVKSFTNETVKCFNWTGACALRAGVMYPVNTPLFTLPPGRYMIFTGFIGNPLTRTLFECGINLAEVTC